MSSTFSFAICGVDRDVLKDYSFSTKAQYSGRTDFAII
jgi:hypothetical protein